MLSEELTLEKLETVRYIVNEICPGGLFIEGYIRGLKAVLGIKGKRRVKDMLTEEQVRERLQKVNDIRSTISTDDKLMEGYVRGLEDVLEIDHEREVENGQTN